MITVKSNDVLNQNAKLDESIIKEINKGNELIYIIGRPATGKTTLLIKSLQELLQYNENKILFVSLELDKDSISEKIDINEHSNLIIMDNPNVSTEELREILRNDNSIKNVVIDYLQLFDCKNNNKCIDLNKLKQEFNLNVIVSSQISRTLEINEEIINNSDNIILIEQ